MRGWSYTTKNSKLSHYCMYFGVTPSLVYLFTVTIKIVSDFTNSLNSVYNFCKNFTILTRKCYFNHIWFKITNTKLYKVQGITLKIFRNWKILNFNWFKHTLRKKCMQQNFFCCPDKTFCCPNKKFCLSKPNFIDIAKCFVGITKEFCCINTNKIFLLIWQNCFLSVKSSI